MQALGLGHYTAVLDLAAGAQLAKPVLVHVQRPGADGVAARQCDLGPPAPTDQRAENAHRCPQLAHRSIIGLVLEFGRRSDTDHGTSDLHITTQPLQHVPHQRDIQDLGTVAERRSALGQ